jgi:hypothetical protein
MNQSDAEREALRRYIDANLEGERSKQRIIFAGLNVGLFLLFSVLAWFIFPQASSSGELNSPALGGLIVLTVGWGVTAFLHVMSALMETQWGTRQIRRNLAVRFRIERTIFGSALHALEDEEATKHAPQREKAKRQAMRLSDDGELVPVEADADARDAEISSASRER